MADVEDSFELTLAARPDAFNEVAARNRQAIYDAYASDKGAKLFEMLADDVLFAEAESLPYGVELRGVVGVQQGVAGMFEAWSSLKAEIEEIVAAGDIVIAYLMMTATSRATGKVYRGQTAEMFRFRDGKIIEWRPIYWDTHAVRVACGLVEEA